MRRRPAAPAPPCSIAPPDLLARLAERGTAAQRATATRTLALSAAVRAHRATLNQLVRAGLAGPALREGERVSVYDARHGEESALPGRKVRGTGDAPVQNAAVNQAYDGADHTYEFYEDVYDRDSVDGAGLELVSSVHFSRDFDNAFWDGQQMVYGDGSGEIFEVGALTRDIAVIAHELTHGITQYTAGLEYHAQSGALNESFSDVFGSLVKQYGLEQSAEQADWLIGAGLLGTELSGEALRSMKAPGTAYEGDNQPADMDGYVDLPDDDDPRNDNGGVHTNSGIPNHAFYLAATAIGGNAWEAAGQVWFDALTTELKPAATFEDAAQATISVATTRFGKGSAEVEAIQGAWEQVKVL
jgi:Zn-dependent metalloprotease